MYGKIDSTNAMASVFPNGTDTRQSYANCASTVGVGVVAIHVYQQAIQNLIGKDILPAAANELTNAQGVP